MGRPCLCCCPNCEKCITFEEFDQDYDYGLLICNVNAVRDDEFNVYLNDIFFDAISELGENQCKGKWFVTNNNIVEKIINSKDNPCNEKNIQPPICCYENTTSQKLLDEDQKLAFFSENFKVFLENTKNNNSGNYGYIGIWRIKKNTNIVCQLGTSYYAGGSGQDLTVNLSGGQDICCTCDDLLNNGGLVVNLDYDRSVGLSHTSPEELLFLFNPAGFSTTKLNPCNLNLSSDHTLCSDTYSDLTGFYQCDDQSYQDWTFLDAKISSSVISPNNFSPPEIRYRQCFSPGLILHQGQSEPPQYVERDAVLYQNPTFFTNCNVYSFPVYRFFIKLGKIENIIKIKNIYDTDNNFTSNISQTKNFYYLYGILTYSAQYIKNYRWKLNLIMAFGGYYVGYYYPETPLESTWRIWLGSNPSTQFPYDYNGLFSCSQCMGTLTDYSELQVLNTGQPASIYPNNIDRIEHKSASRIKNYKFSQNCDCENLLEIMQLDLINSDNTTYPFNFTEANFSNTYSIPSSVLDTFNLNNIKIKYTSG